EPAAAERELRRGFTSLERMGETFNQPNLAAMLAHALHAQGRAEEALRFSVISEETTGAEDVFTQAQWRSARAKVLAGLGRAAEAVGSSSRNLDARLRTGGTELERGKCCSVSHGERGLGGGGWPSPPPLAPVQRCCSRSVLRRGRRLTRSSRRACSRLHRRRP